MVYFAILACLMKWIERFDTFSRVLVLFFLPAKILTSANAAALISLKTFSRVIIKKKARPLFVTSPLRQNHLAVYNFMEKKIMNIEESNMD